MVFTIFDQENNIYSDENTAIGTLLFKSKSSLHPDSALVGNQVRAVNGKFTFSSFTVRIEPNSKTEIKLVITDLQAYNNEVSFLKSPPVYEVTARACIEGEYYD